MWKYRRGTWTASWYAQPEGWADAGLGWEGVESELRVTGWSKMRRPPRHSVAEGEKTCGRSGCGSGTVEITSTHAKALLITAALTRVSGFLKQIKVNAEQLTQPGRWRLIRSETFRVFLRDKVPGSTARMAAAPA